ncbi:universal stress protein [Streptomyces sp. NPDC054802]
MSNSVIVGVDGSVSSLDAVDVAACEAHLCGAPLRIVHAFGQASGRLPTVAPRWNPADQALLHHAHCPVPVVRGKE